MLKIQTTNKFNKDLKAINKQGNKKGIKELEAVVGKLQNGEQLDARYKDHKLNKNTDIPEGSRGCHLLFDLILVYSIKDDILLLQQLGNHHTLKGFKESLETVEEDIEKHDTLNPKLFDENNKLKPEVHDKILEIVDEFVKGLEEDGIKIKVKDVKIVGSNCSYNYNKDSDLDVHIVADTKDLECPDDLYPLLYSAYRSIWNNKIDIDFYGIPVELYVETIDDEIDTDAEPMGESLKEELLTEMHDIHTYMGYELDFNNDLIDEISADIPEYGYKNIKDKYAHLEDADIIEILKDDKHIAWAKSYSDARKYIDNLIRQNVKNKVSRMSSSEKLDVINNNGDEEFGYKSDLILPQDYDKYAKTKEYVMFAVSGENINEINKKYGKNNNIEFCYIDNYDKISNPLYKYWYTFDGEEYSLLTEKALTHSAEYCVAKKDYDLTLTEVGDLYPMDYMLEESLRKNLTEAKQENAVKSNGVYSVLKDKWIKEPVQADIPDIDMNAFEELFREWEDKYFDTVESNSVETIENFIEDIYDLRKSSINNEGEYGLGNLVFKECRAMGYLDNLKDLKNELKSKELSLEGLDEKIEIEESMVGKGSISNDKIIGYINDCIDAMKKLNFKTKSGQVIDYSDIDCKEGSTTNTFGTMSLPNTSGGNFTLTLNKHMYEEPEEAIKNTILHELCHYVQDKQAIDVGAIYNFGGKWFGDKRKGYDQYKSHGNVWKNIARIVGNATNQNITRTNNYNTHTGVGQHYEDNVKYIVKCNNCGNEYKYQKMTDFVKNPNMKSKYGDWYKYRCGNCGAKGQFETVNIKDK